MQKIIVDMTPGYRMPTINFSQGDVGTQFAVDLRSRFGDSLPASATVTVQATKPSGLGFSVAATSVTNGVAVFTTTAVMTDEAGRFPAEIKVVKDSLTMFTANFNMDGEATTHPEGTIDGQQDTLLPELTQLVERVEDAASSVLDMTVEAETLAAGSQATYSYDEDTNTATFGIPQGEAGAGAAGVTASAYSSSSTYAVGDYVIHNSNLYRCTTAITTAEAFTAAHWTQVVLGDDVSDLKSALNDISKIVYPPNRFNRLAVTAGFIDASGIIYDSTTYCYSDYIPVEAGKTYTFWAYSTQAGGIASTNARFLTAYDASKAAQSASGGTYVSSYTVPNGIKYIRISIYQSQASADALFAMCEGATYVGGTHGSEYFDPYYKVTEKALADTVNSKHRVLAQNKGYSVSYSSLYGGNLKQDLDVEFDEMGGFDLVFNGDITTFTDVTFGIGYNEVYGCRIIVTSTDLTLYYNGAEQETFAHGLTFKDYINVDVKFYSNTTRADIFIDTNGGHYLKQYAVLACRKGHPFAVVSGTQISNSYLAVFCSNWNHKIWMYGDSYFNSGDPARWTHWLFARSKANNIMLDGYPGRDSQSALLSLKTAITMACPEKIIWCLGMNNGDSGAINSDWLSAINEVIGICDEYGIELILATIPNVPSVDNTYKNAYVRASGRRYIDFASAVGASADTTWYSGTLSGDNLHPTTEGAYALYRQAITDIPELNTQTELS